MNIFLAESSDYSSEALNIYRSMGSVTLFNSFEEIPIEQFCICDILVVRLGQYISKSILDSFTNLKFLVSPTTGHNHIDEAALNYRGIKLISLKGESDFLQSITSTAEHAWLLMMSLYRNLFPAVLSTRNFLWDRNQFVGSQLNGLSIGIIGYGRVGKQLSSFAHAFGMKVYVNDIAYITPDNRISITSLDNLLTVSDSVFLCANYDPESKFNLDMTHFSLMKTTSLFINISRGEMVDETALLYCLRNSLIRGSALDVFSNEANTSSHALASLDLFQYASCNSNLILTPHIAGATYESMRRTEVFVALKLQQFNIMQ